MYLSEDRIDKGFFPYGPGLQCGMIHNDHLGTPQKMTDASGQVVWAADYKPFGEAAVTVSAITNNLRFPGQYYDAETGLNYNYFRDYNPVIGRYVEADPIGLRGGINLYRYVANKPIAKVDKYGLAMDWPGGAYYGGFEGHALLGGGVETYICCNGTKLILQVFVKVCLGAALGSSVGVGEVFGDISGDKCPEIFSGPSIEGGFGLVEGSITIAPGMPASLGLGIGEGFKFTPCWYFPMHEPKVIGCCKK